MKNINQEEFVSLSNEANHVVIDVRRPDECEKGIVENAILINFMDSAKFKDTIDQLDKSKHYLIYCRSGNRSGKSCIFMDQLGFENTYNLVGGILDWKGNVVVPK